MPGTQPGKNKRKKSDFAAPDPHADHFKRAEKELLFVGCVHGDPRGYGKLTRLLYHENPDHILVELSPWGLFFRQRYRAILFSRLNARLKKLGGASLPPYEQLLKHPSIKAIKLKFSIPYEFRGAFDYSRESSAPVSLIDSSLFSRKQTDKWVELIETGNLRFLLEQDVPSLDSQCRRQYRMARGIIGNPSRPHPAFLKFLPDGDKTLEEREFWLVNQVKLYIRHFPFKKIAIIVGWKHLPILSGCQNLASPFRPMNSRVALLSYPLFYL